MNEDSCYLERTAIVGSALEEYYDALTSSSIQPFLTYYETTDVGVIEQTISRPEFFLMTMQTISLLLSLGIRNGDKQVNLPAIIKYYDNIIKI